MAWTARITTVSKEVELVSVNVEYTDGIQIITKTYKGTGQFDISEIVRNQIRNLEATAAATILPGEVVPSVVNPPTSEFLQLQADLRKLQIAKLLVDMGGIQASNTKVVELVDRIKLAIPNCWDQI